MNKNNPEKGERAGEMGAIVVVAGALRAGSCTKRGNGRVGWGGQAMRYLASGNMKRKVQAGNVGFIYRTYGGSNAHAPAEPWGTTICVRGLAQFN
jgi:hypothetical protein